MFAHSALGNLEQFTSRLHDDIGGISEEQIAYQHGISFVALPVQLLKGPPQQQLYLRYPAVHRKLPRRYVFDGQSLQGIGPHRRLVV